MALRRRISVEQEKWLSFKEHLLTQSLHGQRWKELDYIKSGPQDKG